MVSNGSPSQLCALLWDVDGTLCDTELEGHRPAFNRAFADAGLPWHWDRQAYGRWLSIAGGHERIRAFLRQVEGAEPDPRRVEALQAAKQAHYATLVAEGCLPLRPGVARLLEEARNAGLRQVIVTTSGRGAVKALLGRLLPSHADLFELWVCGEDVGRKKPDPEAYDQALAALQLGAPAALALEDSGNGLAAARAAGVVTLVTRSDSSAAEPSAAFAAAAAEFNHLGDPGLPAVVHRGPACPTGLVTLSYLQALLVSP